DIKRLPNYACVQTITRSVYIPASPNKRPPRCEDIIRDRNSGKRNLKLRSLDRLRVDVAIVDKREMYSWVGATQFEESDLSKLVGGGQTVMGDFGSLVLSVFNDHPSLRLEGER